MLPNTDTTLDKTQSLSAPYTITQLSLVETNTQFKIRQ